MADHSKPGEPLNKALTELETFLAKPQLHFTEAGLKQAEKLGEAVGLAEPVPALPESVRKEIAEHVQASFQHLTGGQDVKEHGNAPATPVVPGLTTGRNTPAK